MKNTPKVSCSIAAIISIVVIQLLTSHISHAQTDTINVCEINNSVRDSSGAVAYANIYISRTNIGTVANEQGSFLLKVPFSRDLLKDTVIVSSIGYETKRIALADLLKLKTSIILTPAKHWLPEVVVGMGVDSSQYFLDKAISSIKKNYLRRKHLMEAFYRELSVKDTIYTRLIEAAILVQEPPYKGNTVDSDELTVDGNKIRIIAFRKSADNRDYDALGWAYKKLFGEKNDIYAMLNENFVRFIGKRNSHFLSKTFLKEYDLSTETNTMFEGDPIIVIKLTSKNSEIFFTREVTLYINRSDFGILKIEYGMIANQGNKQVVKSAIDGKYIYHTIITYTKTGESYAPFYIHTKKYASNTNALQNGHLQYSSIELLRTNIFFDDFDKIKAKYTLEKDSDINDLEIEYDPKFWAGYNTVVVNKLGEKAKRDLEKERSLEAQFKRK